MEQHTTPSGAFGTPPQVPDYQSNAAQFGQLATAGHANHEGTTGGTGYTSGPWAQYTDPATVARIERQYQARRKSKPVTFIFWIVLGLIGGHRFYLGQKGIGTAMLLTVGGFGFWALIDLFLIPSAWRKANERIYRDASLRNGVAA